MQKQLTAIIEREDDGYSALCPELDIASQGDSVEEARDNLREALELFFQTASDDEVHLRLQDGTRSMWHSCRLLPPAPKAGRSILAPGGKL
jgi:predicted RNase H-like HicB family nuclease